MPRIEIIAPALDDGAALEFAADLAAEGFQVTARGPCIAYPGDAAFDAMEGMSPAERRDHYEAERLRLENERARMGEMAVRADVAPSGWHIVATRGEGTD